MTPAPGTRIGFLGAGRVAQTLAQAFTQAGLPVVAVHSRSRKSAEALHRLTPTAQVMLRPHFVLDACDTIFITVSDDAIAAVCRDLPWHARHRVIHCSGVTEVAALDPARAKGAATAGFHPMQMFANPEVALRTLPGCIVGIEADPPFDAELRALAEAIGCVPFTVAPGVRPIYHASTYYVGPFLIALLNESAQLWQRMGASEAEALKAMVPLLRGTVAAVLDGGLAQGMGGCVARGDVGTVAKHLTALDALSSSTGALYRELARRTVPLGIQRGTLSDERAMQINNTLNLPAAAPGR
ncbi:MAG: DUF2520 domain-containing protein [Pseudomonadota bacterium]|nr:DUF2520 domain-containing protein [Pseudomonadota bacterium]